MCAENDHACPNADATPQKLDEVTPGDELETRDTASIRRLNDPPPKTGRVVKSCDYRWRPGTRSGIRPQGLWSTWPPLTASRRQ